MELLKLPRYKVTRLDPRYTGSRYKPYLNKIGILVGKPSPGVDGVLVYPLQFDGNVVKFFVHEITRCVDIDILSL